MCSIHLKNKNKKKIQIFGTFFNKIRQIGFPVHGNVILIS